MRILIVIAAILFSVSVVAQHFVHPMDFDGSEAQKQQVVNYIKARVRHEYCDSGLDMCQPTTLRMMEQENLNAFKAATQLTNRAIMNQVIRDYCHSGVDMCNYSTILMMYQENINAVSQSLDW